MICNNLCNVCYSGVCFSSHKRLILPQLCTIGRVLNRVKGSRLFSLTIPRVHILCQLPCDICYTPQQPSGVLIFIISTSV